MHHALALDPPRHDSPISSEQSGLLSYLDAVYAFALTLTGDDADQAAALTESVFASMRADVASTLGGYGLRDWLLARCVAGFADTRSPTQGERTAARRVAHNRPLLITLLFALPWRQRAAIALIYHEEMSFAAAAAVLRVDIGEFVSLFRRGRRALFDAYRAASVRRSPMTLRRHSPE